VCVGIKTVGAFIGATGGVEFVDAVPLVVGGKITSLKNRNRIGIESFNVTPDPEPECRVKVTVDVVTFDDVVDALAVVVPVVLVEGVELIAVGVRLMGKEIRMTETGDGLVGVGVKVVGVVTGVVLVADVVDSNCRPSSTSAEIEGFRRACRTILACRFCSCCDLMSLFLSELSQSSRKPLSLKVRSEPIGYESIRTGLASPKHAASVVGETPRLLSAGRVPTPIIFLSNVMHCGPNWWRGRRTGSGPACPDRFAVSTSSGTASPSLGTSLVRHARRRIHALRGQINVAATPCGWRLTRLTERKAVRRRASVP
jgi:hypothetical protein